jgi:pimeloyl-ACP methyl ester carboxylesterase
MPDLARQMQEEGNFALPDDQAAPAGEFMDIEDRGAGVTIFAFAGLDVLYAGFARYEFRGVLHRLGIDANLVFVRDVQRMAYQLRPDGSVGGPAFYADELVRVKETLGARRNIAIGSSIGGAAAFAFGAQCGMDEVVMFGAFFNLEGFTAPSMLARTVFNFRQLAMEPRAYVELLVVTLAGRWARKAIIQRLGEENLSKPLDIYQQAVTKPAVTLFYGIGSWPDTSQAKLIEGYPKTRLVPLPTGRHNTPSFLKQRGTLEATLAEALLNPPNEGKP